MVEARSTQGMPAVVPELSLSVLPDTFRYSDGDTHGYHGTKEMAQVVKCLLYKHKDLSLIPRSYVKKPGMVVCTLNPNPGEVEKMMGPWDLLVSQLSRFCESEANERPLFKK